MPYRVEAVSSGPISFNSEGQQLLISPPNAIYFEDGKIATDYRGRNAAVDAAILKWLEFLVTQDQITKGRPLSAAMTRIVTVNAVVPGQNGNAIEVKFEAVLGSPSQVKVSVTATETYAHLTLATIEGVLGRAAPGATVGSRPGLLRVKTLGTNPPVNGSATRKGTLDPQEWELFDGQSTPALAVSLVHWKAGAKGTTTAVVTDAIDVGGTVEFKLTVTWTHVVTITPTGTTPDYSKLAELDFAVTFDPATGWSALPALVTKTLGGGSEHVAAVRARTDVLART